MKEHPFEAGTTVRCRRATEPGIPIAEGEIYTVKRPFIGPQQDRGDPIEGMEHTPGVELIEVPGFFLADRFELIRE